jgi:transcriptional regulator with XRE-family HTH domain
MAIKSQEIREIFSKNVKEQRKNLGFTLEKLAELTGLAVQTINDIEGGRRWVSDKTIAKLSTALHIESYQLFIVDFFKQDRKIKTPTHLLLDFKEKLMENIDSQVEAQFNEYLKSNLLQDDKSRVQREIKKRVHEKSRRNR